MGKQIKLSENTQITIMCLVAGITFFGGMFICGKLWAMQGFAFFWAIVVLIILVGNSLGLDK